MVVVNHNQSSNNGEIVPFFVYIQTKEDKCGSLLLCGGTNWDLAGRKELPKSASKFMD